ncbi:5-formyltetrahydrofolate cyclo-ligase [Pelobacter sp. M08fum]|uniref:5-formyltetrahydrofolate cyclo-ligase n=2 Tax=Pelovirga terrestris TaxID=2771352 RepID=A0A8J6UQ32_9BACT|nr:5-formyltetrahydrofolate cyclo-ligase [Pelovirga terrestris]
MLKRRRALLPEQVAQLSHLAQQQLVATELFCSAQRLALYSPIHNETATSELFVAAARQGKQVYYPRVVKEGLCMVEIDRPEQLVPGAFGVLEPATDLHSSQQVPDVILIPGVAFDRRGHRLGYGRGFYDRYLACCSDRAVRVGFCYSFQLCDALPVGAHDQSLDILVTDTETITWWRRLPGLT